jgi:glutathione S-transferase
MITLHDYDLSADCYKVRLLLGILQLPYERVELDVYPEREHRLAAFRAVDPLGRVPVLDDDGVILRDWAAILVYLAQRYDGAQRWFPRVDRPDAAQAASLGRLVEWLSFAQRLAGAAGAARLHDTIFEPADIERCRASAHELFRVLDEHLWFAEQQDCPWLCGRDPTIADLACFPDVVLSEEGGVSRLPYPAIRRWTDRIKRLPNFTTMAGVFPA